MYCNTCKHWIDGECTNNEFLDWVYLGDSRERVEPTKLKILINVLDDSGLYAYINTGPMFGCVHHEEYKP